MYVHTYERTLISSVTPGRVIRHFEWRELRRHPVCVVSWTLTDITVAISHFANSDYVIWKRYVKLKFRFRSEDLVSIPIINLHLKNSKYFLFPLIFTRLALTIFLLQFRAKHLAHGARILESECSFLNCISKWNSKEHNATINVENLTCYQTKFTHLLNIC